MAQSRRLGQHAAVVGSEFEAVEGVRALLAVPVVILDQFEEVHDLQIRVRGSSPATLVLFLVFGRTIQAMLGHAQPRAATGAGHQQRAARRRQRQIAAGQMKGQVGIDAVRPTNCRNSSNLPDPRGGTRCGRTPPSGTGCSPWRWWPGSIRGNRRYPSFREASVHPLNSLKRLETLLVSAMREGSRSSLRLAIIFNPRSMSENRSRWRTL